MNGNDSGASSPPAPRYDADSRRWMVQVDQFVARPATERETFEAVKKYVIEAVRHGCAELGADVVQDIIEPIIGRAT